MRDVRESLPDTDELLRTIGLRRSGSGDSLVTSLTLFGAGIIVGAALGLLFARESGEELREDLKRRLSGDEEEDVE